MKPPPKKQVLVFMLAPPLPATTGGNIYAVNALIPFAHDIDYHLFCYVGGDADVRKVAKYKENYDKVFKTIHLEPRPAMPFQMPRVRRVCWMVWQVMQGLPFIDASYYSRSAVAAAKAIVRRHGIDALEINSTHLAFFKKFLPSIPALLISHNIESDIFPFWMPAGLFGWRRHFMEWVAKKSRRAANAVEFENSLGFSAMTFISKGDMDRVVSGVPKYLMPLFFPINGVPYERKPGDRFNVLWMGGFGWYPNAQGVIWFAKEVYPRISDNLHASNITFHFCGSHPPDELRALHDGIDFHVHGFVNDIQAMLDDAHLLIVPLCSGGGIRVKIIEAMSSGIPVLSTHKGCEGIGVEDGRNIIVRDDPAEFAEEIVLASRDPRKMYELSIAGLQFMSDQYSREATLDAKRKAYEQVGVF